MNCKLAIISIILILFHNLQAGDKPNILWLTSEDNSVEWVGCYGNKEATTPNLDNLAKEGFQYTHCYSNAPVCAPSRSGWITGIHAVSTGTSYMRSRNPIPHNIISYYPDLLKKAGYYVSNDNKTDYNIGGRNDSSAWNATKTNWETLKKNQPFFHVYNSNFSHESKAFGDVTKTSHDPLKIKLAPYHPDLLPIRQNYAHYMDAVEKMDSNLGKILEQLKANGLSENTIIVYNSDHGGVMPRSKRFLYNSGTHCPLIIKIPEKFKEFWPADKTGSKVDRLVSFIDMPKTWLSICGAETPEYLQGKIFLGKNTENENTYHVSYRDRMDEKLDSSRAIRDKRYLLIRNYMPFVPGGQHLNYLWKMTATQSWHKYFLDGKTDEITGKWFKPKEPLEFYDTLQDPHNINNLAQKPEYQELIKKMNAELDTWQQQNFDAGLLPEAEILHLAKQNKLTIYEFIRDSKLYKLKEYQKVANLALEINVNNLSTFIKELQNKDIAIRYWSIIGSLLLQDKNKINLEEIKPSLNDSSDEIKAYAALIFYRAGEKEAAKQTWLNLLKNNSYASLTVANMLDWTNEGAAGFEEALKNCQFTHDDYLIRMNEYFGISK